MDEFECLLSENKSAVEHFVLFRISNRQDAEDIFQETCYTAWRHFGDLKDRSQFKAWMISIARNKCNDYYREKAKKLDIQPIDALIEKQISRSVFGITETDVVSETLGKLGGREKQILYLYYFKQMPQSKIADKLGIPLGTVKSRLHTAKRKFRELHPYHTEMKGTDTMAKLPETMPEYKIERVDKEPFEVVWEELMGWMIVPKTGEKLTWGDYDMPSGKLMEWCEMEAGGEAEVHGIRGIEIFAKSHQPWEWNATDGSGDVERRFVAQLTDSHCRYLAESHVQNGVRYYYTFLDGDLFSDNWGFGENNCGNETHLTQKGDILRNGNEVTCADKPFLLDIVGRYSVTVNGKTYDTVCVMDVGTYESKITTEQYLDKNGRTILWRRFNRDDWAFGRYQKKWSEMRPDNERLIINGETFVHWYDGISDYIL